MAKNVPGATFVSRGMEYVLDFGPKGNLRPYTVGPIKTAIKSRNPYIIGATVIVVVAAAIGLWAWKRKTKNSQS